MGSDDFIVDRATKSYDKPGGSHSEEKKKRIIYKMVSEQAWTPFAHAQICLAFEAPLFIARQLATHRGGFAGDPNVELPEGDLPISEVSRRYVNKPPEFYVPDKWRDKWGGVVEFDGYESVPGWYLSHIEEIGNLYKMLVERHNITPEQARMILPTSTLTRWDWTGSLPAWARVYNLRNSKTHAQPETSTYAEGIKEIIEPLFPISWKALTES